MTQAGPAPSIAKASRSPLWRRALRALNPVAIATGIPGAVFHKEVAVGGRRVSTYIVRGAFVLAVLGVAALVILTSMEPGYSNQGPAAQLQQYQTVAPALTLTIGWCTLIGLTLVGVSRGGASISDERRMGTLSALMTTPLMSWQIVLGKTLSILIEILVLGLATAPLLLAARAFGGVTVEVIARITVLTLLHATAACVLSLFWSVNFRRSGSAMLTGLGVLAMIEIGPGLIALLADRTLREFGLSFSQFSAKFFGLGVGPESVFMLTCTPAVFQLSMMELMGMGGGFPAFGQSLVLAHAAYLCFWIVVGFFATSIVLRRRLALDAAGAAESVKPAGKKRKKNAAQDTATDGQEAVASAVPVVHESRGESREVGDQPVMWRELEQRTFRKRWHMVAAALTIAGFLLYLYIQVGVDEEGLHFTLAVLGALGILCVAAASTTAGITSEREGRTWETLLTTPLSAWEIITGKFAGALRKQIFLPSILFAHVVLGGILTGNVGVSALVFMVPILLGPVLLLTATGSYCSLALKRSSAASTLNFLLALGAFGGLPMVCGILMSISGTEDGLQGLFGTIMAFNPVGMSLLAIGGAIDGSPMSRGGTYDFFDVWDLSMIEYAGVVFAVFAAELGATFLVLRLTAARLARESGRTR